MGFDELPGFLKRRIKLPPGVTDVFVWVHGWQNDELRATSTANRLFAALNTWFKREAGRYPKLGEVVPAFVAVHWPSNSMPGLTGYRKIRRRARSMTTLGVAEYFLAPSLMASRSNWFSCKASMLTVFWTLRRLPCACTSEKPAPPQ